MRMLHVPVVISQALDYGAALVISISGGKDSQALLNAVVHHHRVSGATGPVYAIHADLGRAEWPQTPGHVERIAREAGVPLVVVRRPQGDLVARWEERMVALEGTGKPFWSSAANRYCTSDLKRGPIDRQLRTHQLVISVEGVRADESPARARKPVVAIRGNITSATLKDMDPETALAHWTPGRRLALTWYAIHDWAEQDVWAACGTSQADLAIRQARYRAGDEAGALDGWPAHPAYVYGNQRLSCALCVLASLGDIRNGAKHHPELYRKLVSMEQASGWTFKAGRSLVDIVESGAA